MVLSTRPSTAAACNDCIKLRNKLHPTPGNWLLISDEWKLFAALIIAGSGERPLKIGNAIIRTTASTVMICHFVVKERQLPLLHA